MEAAFCEGIGSARMRSSEVLAVLRLSGYSLYKTTRGLEEIRVATREDSGVLCFPSRRGLTPRGILECNPEIPAFPGEEH